MAAFRLWPEGAPWADGRRSSALHSPPAAPSAGAFAHTGPCHGVQRPRRGSLHRRAAPDRRVDPRPGERFADEWEGRGYGQNATILRETGQFIGRIGLHYWPEWDEVELGYVLARSAQGRGLATEGARAWLDIAAAIPDLDHVIANIHPENHSSTRLAEKLGFAFGRHDTTPSGQPTLIYRLDF